MSEGTIWLKYLGNAPTGFTVSRTELALSYTFHPDAGFTAAVSIADAAWLLENAEKSFTVVSPPAVQEPVEAPQDEEKAEPDVDEPPVAKTEPVVQPQKKGRRRPAK